MDIRIRKKNGKLIGACYGYLSHKEEAEANAAFICKACNNYDSLLEALKEIVELFPNNPKLPISHQVLEIAKAAIKKAGETII